MVQYFLETYDTEHTFWPAPGEATRAEFLKLIHFGPATAYHVVVPIFLHYMHGTTTDPPINKEIESKKKEWHSVVAPTLEQALEKFGGPYLLGEKFSAADMVCGYDLVTVSFASCAAELLDPHPKVKTYLDIISQREVYKTLYTFTKDDDDEKNQVGDEKSKGRAVFGTDETPEERPKTKKLKT